MATMFSRHSTAIPIETNAINMRKRTISKRHRMYNDRHGNSTTFGGLDENGNKSNMGKNKCSLFFLFFCFFVFSYLL